jgi:hypothetical protein
MCAMKKRAAKIVAAAVLGLVFWFVTAPADMALERLISRGNSTAATRFIDGAIDAYSYPMAMISRRPSLRNLSDNLSDFWCNFLAHPKQLHDRHNSAIDCEKAVRKTRFPRGFIGLSEQDGVLSVFLYQGLENPNQ